MKVSGTRLNVISINGAKKESRWSCEGIKIDDV